MILGLFSLLFGGSGPAPSLQAEPRYRVVLDAADRAFTPGARDKSYTPDVRIRGVVL